MYSSTPAAPSHPDHPGDVHLHTTYELCQTLGSGNFGVVRLGIVKQTGEKVAVKMIDQKKITKGDDRSTFSIKKEFRIMQMINHPNIVRVHECFEGARTSYIIME